MKLDEKISDVYESMNEFNSASADKAVLEARVEQAKDRCFNTFDTICLYVLEGILINKISIVSLGTTFQSVKRNFKIY